MKTEEKLDGILQVRPGSKETACSVGGASAGFDGLLRSQYRYILFDLDGTLTDSAEGIINSVIYALNKYGITENDRDKLTAFVGPPLTDSFMKYYGVTREDAAGVLTRNYRAYFSERGWAENRVYEGIPQALETLKAAGKHLIVATSKPEVFAKRIMEHFGLAQYFDVIGGSTLDGSISRKGDVIAYVIRQIGEEHLGEMIMVGDREHDVIGAREQKLPCIGVLYGYGSREELEAAGAYAVCETVEKLVGAQ